MSNKKHNGAASPETQAGEPSAQAENTAEKENAKKAKSSPLEEEISRLSAELAQSRKDADAAKAALAEQKDQYLRVAAEYDNYRKRSQKEREGIYSSAYADVMKQLLPVIDNQTRR